MPTDRLVVEQWHCVVEQADSNGVYFKEGTVYTMYHTNREGVRWCYNEQGQPHTCSAPFLQSFFVRVVE